MHKSSPTRQKNQLAYELMLSFREEHYAIRRSTINAQIDGIIGIDNLACDSLYPSTGPATILACDSLYPSAGPATMQIASLM